MILSKVQFLVLCALIRCPMHPYSIRQEVMELAGNMYKPSHSTIRNALNKLLNSGYVAEWADDPYYWLKAKRGVPYELTLKGRRQVKQELKMYRDLVIITRMWLKREADIKAREKLYKVFN